MKALIYKDLMAQKKTLALTVILILVLTTDKIFEGSLMLLPLLFLLLPIILVRILFGTDMQCGIDKYIIPAPVKRKTIVLSRYALVWGMAGIGVIVAIIVGLFDKNLSAALPWYLIAPVMLLLNTIGAGIQLPLIYKFGMDKSNIVFMLIYFSFFGAMSYVGKNKELIAELISKLTTLNIGVISLIIFAIAIIFNLASFYMAAAVYERTEF
jgi:hypothetical protein